jgi:hypothetical protein
MTETNSENDYHSQSIDRDRDRDRDRENEELRRQVEELKNTQSLGSTSDSAPKPTANHLSFISDFLGSVLSSMVSSHSALSANFGGGIRGAFFASVYQVIFMAGLASTSYVFYQITNTQEQRVYIPNEESTR